MKKNMGIIDRIVRGVLAIVFIAVAYFYNIWWLYIFAAIFIVTASISFCPSYKLFGISTKKE